MWIQKFIEGLPWYVKGPAGICGAIVGHFADKLPTWLEPYAIIGGFGLFAWVIAAFLWHAINHWRVERGKTAIMLEPWHIISLGLVIALGGLLWQWRHVPAPDPQIAILQSQITNLERLTKESTERQTATDLDLSKTKQALEEKTRELEKAKTAPPEATAAAPKRLRVDSQALVVSPPPDTSTLLVPGRFYSTAEKERIVDTMNLIQQGFNNVGRPMMWQAEKIAANPGQNEEIDRAIERMQAVYADAEKLSGDLEKIRNESHNYPVDFAVLLAAKPVYYDEFQRAVNDYTKALTVYRQFLSDTGEHRGTLAQVVGSAKRHLSRAKFALEKWMQECDEQMRGARRLLEK